MTEASRQALTGLRDWSTLKWYAIPLLSVIFYIYVTEIKRARKSGDWNPVLAGLTLFGMDFINESWNGWVLALSGRAACWTAPGPTALRTMVGWNLEIMFMFALAGIIYYHSLSEPDEATPSPLYRRKEAWLVAVGYAAFSVLVECLLNKGGHLVWEYAWWNRSLGGVWLIFGLGYFHFFVAIILVLSLPRMKQRLVAIGSLYALAIAMNVFGLGIMGWRY